MTSTITLPDTFIFSTSLPVRIDDINYGQHLGHDSLISLLHEARLQFLAHHQIAEHDIFGSGWIMIELHIEYKSQAFYGDILTVSLDFSPTSKTTISVTHLVFNKTTGKELARAKAKLTCFNYHSQKIMRIPPEFITLIGC